MAYSKKVEYLNELRKTENEKNQSDKALVPEKSLLETIKFEGSPTEYVELVKALSVSGMIKGTLVDNLKKLNLFFEMDVSSNKYHKTFEDICGRNHGSETLFLDDLKSQLFTLIKQKSKR